MFVLNQFAVNHTWTDDSKMTAISAENKISIFRLLSTQFSSTNFVFSHKISIGILTFFSSLECLPTFIIYKCHHGNRKRIKVFE